MRAIELDLGGRRVGAITRMDVENKAGELLDTRIIISARWQDEPGLGSQGVAFSIDHVPDLIRALQRLTRKGAR